MRVLMFPGMGSQHLGMGRELFAAFPERAEEAESVLGRSIRRLCLEDPDRQLSDTAQVQPAIHTVNCLAFLAYQRAGGVPPVAVLGHSLGELAALFAAGVVDFSTGLKLVQVRADLMASAGRGAMAAISGISRAELTSFVPSSSGVDFANLNSASQTVISGSEEGVRQVLTKLQRLPSVTCFPLRVRSASHSRYMRSIAEEYRKGLAALALRAPTTPVLANATAERYASGDIDHTLARQLYQPVRWHECIARLKLGGVTEFIELGPSRRLTQLVDSIRKEPSFPPEWKPYDWLSVNPPPREQRSARPDFPLGSVGFCQRYGVRRPYVAGSMRGGISSVPLVARMAAAGYLAFFGASELDAEQIANALVELNRDAGRGKFGCSFAATNDDEETFERVGLLLRHGISRLETRTGSALHPALVWYRAAGLTRVHNRLAIGNRVLAKTSLPALAGSLLRPAPDTILRSLLQMGRISPEQAEICAQVPLADDICLECDTGSYTSQRSALALFPTLRRMRDDVVAAAGYAQPIHLGLAGGLGSGDAIFGAFMLGADFVMTGSINQCTVESGQSDAVKDILQRLTPHDTAMAPAGDADELGQQIQVMRKGNLFASKAQRLHDLYRAHEGLDELAPETCEELERDYFRERLDEVIARVKTYSRKGLGKPERSATHRKHEMGLVFREYYRRCAEAALRGDVSRRVEFQVHTGPALGSLNQQLAGTELENWRSRRVDGLAEHLLQGALTQWRQTLLRTGSAGSEYSLDPCP